MTTLLPRPVSFTRGEGEFRGEVRPEVRLVAGEPEGYRLEITPERVLVEASDEAGAFWATQTIRQLRGPDAFRAAPLRPGPEVLPACTVVDHPRFAWRGCMIDVARHFLPKHDLLRYVDLLAAHKLNVLHLHLTDDQGWRFEVKRYPALTEVGSWRPESRLGDRRGGLVNARPHGGFYTQDDLREVVAYAAARHVTVVPEIDVPGHSQAAIAAYPSLGLHGGGVWTDWGINPRVLDVGPETLEFYRNVFDELVEVFPATVIGLGGDEVPDQGPEHGAFVRALAAHLAGHGRRPYGWDEIAESGPLPHDVIIASWRGEEQGVAAVREGHDVVMCPERHVYLDYRQSDLPSEPIPVGTVLGVEDVYRYSPVPPEITGGEPGRVLGAQANLWTEHVDSPRRLDYAAFPRLSAFAEVVWGTAGDPAFLDRLTSHHLPRLDALGVEYRPLAGPHPWQSLPGVPGFPR
jgi:hexosaminidase